MRLFRSEEELTAWCAEHALPRGATVDLTTLRELARRWYGDRLDPDWRPRSTAESQRILNDVGLTGDFWLLG